MTDSRHEHAAPAPWVRRFQPLIPLPGRVLDLACGTGRHSRFLLDMGYQITAIDRDVSGVEDLQDRPGAEIIEADLETGAWPLSGRKFAGIVVVNYLHRPLLPRLSDALAENGVLIYQTFAVGNERFGRPRNPDFLLKEGELLVAFAGLDVVAYEHVTESAQRSSVVQRLCAVNRTAD